jgi:hypothetical protein
MKLKCLSAAALGLALLASPAPSQTAAELMQKAIYAQQTAGDLDTAIQIYRQILTSSGADRKTAAAVQFRLAQALLQKGDLSEAAREFQMLANYPEYKDAIAALAGRVHGQGESVISRGTYNYVAGKPSHYFNRATGTDLTVPAGWAIEDDTSDGGELAVLTDPVTDCGVSVWMQSEQHAVSELSALLQHDLAAKPEMRTDLQGWKIREVGPPESSSSTPDHARLRAVAEFTINGRPWIELLTWVRSTKSHVLFTARFPASQRATMQRRFEEVRDVAVIP